MSKIDDVIELCKPILELCEKHKGIKPDVGQIAALTDSSGATASVGLKMARLALKAEKGKEKK